MKVVALAEVAEIIMGQSPDSASYNANGKGLPFFQGKTDFRELYPEVRMYCTAPKKIAEAGDILISVRAPVGPTNLALERCCIGRGLSAIRPKKQLIQKYALYFLRFFEPNLAALGTGSTFEAISRDDLDELPLPLPPLPEQKRIAAILEKADRVRRLRRYALDLSEGYLQSVFLEMFGDPATNPKGLSMVQLESVCSKVTDGTHLPPPFSERGIPFIFVQSIGHGEIDFSICRYVSEKTYADLTRHTRVERGDIIYSSVGATFGTAIEVQTDLPFVFQRHIAHIKPDRSLINSTFLCAQMNSNYVYKQASRSAKGAAQPTVNLSDIREFRIILPPPDEQKQFASVISKIWRIRAQQREALRQAEHLFQTLLQRAFSSGV